VLNNPGSDRIRALRQLTKRSVRFKERRFLVEGTRAVREALVATRQGEADVTSVLLATDSADGAELRVLALQAGVEVLEAADSVIAALSETVTPQGVVAVCEFVGRPIESLVDASPRLVAVLAEVRDPGNAGSVIRVASISMMMSSGTSWPASMIVLTRVPSALPEATAARSMSPVASCTMPCVCSSRFA